ncbi:MAG: hypothetical protein AMXMBFR8_24920 [Nevskiales bacterium]
MFGTGSKLGRWLNPKKVQQAYQAVQSNQLETAEALCADIISADADQADAHHVLGLVAIRRGDGARAVEAISKAIGLKPSQPDFYSSLGMACYIARRLADATRRFEQALELRPRDAGTLNNLGVCYKEQDQYSEAADAFREAIALDPGQFAAYMNLSSTLTLQGDLDGAVAALREVIALRPAFAAGHSNLLAVLNYRAGSAPDELHREALEFERRYAAALLPAAPQFAITPDPDRVLKIGYVSPDFREHSVAYFIGGLLGAHHRDRVAVYCYADVGRPDDRTRQLQAGADQWRTIAGKSDEAVAAMIREDGIDVLVDLAGHTANNRLLVFARKPAPVQVAWLGYPGTTGMRAMDYRLTDAIADPPGEADRLHVENLVRLPRGFLCYQGARPLPEVAPAPCLAQGHVTFGSFNALPKITPQVLRVWAQILQQVPDARLLLKSPGLTDPPTRVRLVKAFREQGVDSDRVELLGWQPAREDHLGLYGRIDIALDPFPYNGTTTTCEALWMGVPVIALRGNRHAGRVGASLLGQVGLTELVAADEAAYVGLAESLAADRQRLSALRSTLRPRLQDSALMDLPGFTTALEQAYRAMWIQWCRPAGARS